MRRNYESALLLALPIFTGVVFQLNRAALIGPVYLLLLNTRLLHNEIKNLPLLYPTGRLASDIFACV